MPSDISIVIVSWNAQAYLRQCLQSLREEQGSCDFEVTVVDNASIDGSREMVRAEFPETRLICSDSNLGFAKANNIALRTGTSEFACLVNSDIIVRPGCLAAMMQYMRLHDEIGVLGPRILNPDGTLQPSCFGFPGIGNNLSRALALDSLFPKSSFFGGRLMKHWLHNDVRHVESINGCFMLVRRTAMEQVGLLDESFFMYGEDQDWCKRFNVSGWPVVFFPETEAIHFGGASSANAPVRFYVEKLRANLRFWEKHYRGTTRVILFIIACVHELVRVVGYSFVGLISPARRAEASRKAERSLQCMRLLLLGRSAASDTFS